MAMTDRPGTKWRNFLGWGSSGAVVYLFAVGVGTLVRGGGWALSPDHEIRAWQLGMNLAVVLAVAAALGLMSRNRPFNLRSFRAFILLTAASAAVAIPVFWSLQRFVGDAAFAAMRSSERIAVSVGLFLLMIAIAGSATVAFARSGVEVTDNEVAADDMRDRSRFYFLSLAWLAACGMLLIALGLAGTANVLSSAAGLTVALILVAVLLLLGIAVWRLCDELDRTLSSEAGNTAYYLILGLGGGWAILAELGFAPTPRPLDWLTTFVVLSLGASIFVAGRRRLLTR